MTPFASLTAAVVPEGAAAPAHYGDPIREQRALLAGTALVDLSGDRAVIAVAGPERLSWLDSITSQAVGRLAEGSSTELLVLDPQGRVEHAAGVFDDGATAWLIVDAEDAPGLAQWLSRMVFRAQVQVSVRDELSVIGASADGAAAGLVERHAVRGDGAGLVWVDPWTTVTSGGHQYALAETHPGAERPWVEAIVDEDGRAALAAAVQDGAVSAAGTLAAEATRIAAWRPRWSREVDERTIPHELDWLRTAVHLNKGCYRGQETVAKVHNLGHPPRRLTFLHLDGAVSEPGAEVRRDDTVVGAVTSAALHHELGPIALAVLKRSVPIDAPLTVATAEGDVAAAQEPIVPPSAGAEADVPRLPRLSSRR